MGEREDDTHMEDSQSQALLAMSPDACGRRLSMFNNSQSPPSYSPLRCRLDTQESYLSPCPQTQMQAGTPRDDEHEEAAAADGEADETDVEGDAADDEEQPMEDAAPDAFVAQARCEMESGGSSSSSAIVPVEAETAVAPFPADYRSDSWAALPPEIRDATWKIQGDVCSVTVAGADLMLPRAVFKRLYPYQRQGVGWMWNLYRKEHGGCLADAMGVGKTVQVAAFLACLKFTETGTRFLVVVPVALIEQWRRELDSWAGDTGLAVHVLHGTTQERQRALKKAYKEGGVLLTSYDLLKSHVNSLRDLASAVASLPKKRKKQTGRSVRDDDSPSEDDGGPAAAAGEEVVWDVIVVDEAHQIRNPSSTAGRELRRIPARSRFMLTGTPLQNKLIDLWAIMDLAQPALLGNHATFERDFSERISRGSKRNATPMEVELKDHLARQLKMLCAPHFLRRLKEEVAMKCDGIANSQVAPEGEDQAGAPELPGKTDVVLWLKLTPAQQELYDIYLRSELFRLSSSGDGRERMEVLRAINMLKRLCNSPLLLLNPAEFDAWKGRVAPSPAAARPSGQQAEASSSAAAPTPPAEEGAAVVAAAADTAASAAPEPATAAPVADGSVVPAAEATQPAPETHQVLPRIRSLLPNSVEGATLLSCKLRVLSVLLPQLQRRGHRCVLFSHSTRMLDLIQVCVLRVMKLKFLRIDGSVDPKDRDLKIAKFQQPDARYFCMCLSHQSCSVGLTITGADRVILVDPAWNPAMDAQAVDRVHRIGQTRKVVVYRLIDAGAIEDKMFRLQVFKRGIANTALSQEQQLRFFSSEDLKQLFQKPSEATSTQTLMAQRLGNEALEHEELVQVVAGDVGSPEDAAAESFWQSSDMLGFSDYDKLFMYLEEAHTTEVVADGESLEEKARAISEHLRNEEYKKDQVTEGKRPRRAHHASPAKENVAPQEEPVGVLQDG
eukprot:TRINITY_DN21679_c0_g1_i2.p1 TRINITY_DN21679_c0_g1~~TRINITY_DN21679_c0_g1_i2.p1  ORF type:complete len:985 (+),score=239.40 TRINITY_DN21679_c0_g1_i2:98-2956(+)